jgi:hypothetical protein
MKNILLKNFLLVMMLCLSAVSCKKDFLELSPQQSVANESALVTIGDFESSITAVYNGLSGANYYGRYFVLVPDVMSDDVKQHPSANRAKDYAEYSAVVGDGIAEGLWAEMFQNINNLDAIINTQVDIPAAVQDDYNHIIGEALTLRGLIYFDMVRMFAQHYSFSADASHLGVPIVLEFDKDGEPARASVKAVYDQIISDMIKGIAQMSNDTRSGSTSTLSKTSGKALLSRVYLYKDDLANAESMATEVINSTKYTLVDNASYLASWSSDNSDESIFELTMTESDNNGSNALGRMYIVEGYGDYLPSNDVVSLFSTDDVRYGWFIEDTFLDGDYAPFRMNKYPSITGEDNTKVIRLSEVYLIRAEARARQNNDDAQGDVDMIRQRGLPSAPAVTATGQGLIDEVMLERRKELCFEGQRLWDLMRHKQSIIRTQCTSSVCEVNYPNEKLILPIPEAELDANPNMQPNPGY